MNLNLKIIGQGIGMGSIVMWLMILINAHLINNYNVIFYLNNFGEAYIETVVLIVGLLILLYDIIFSVVKKGRELKKKEVDI